MQTLIKIFSFILISSTSMQVAAFDGDQNIKEAEKRYADCMALAQNSPDKGIALALEWQTEGAGVPARHCEAVGLYHLGEFAEAAIRLDQLVEDIRTGRQMPINDGKRMVGGALLLADMYDQAANAWLMANEITRAETAIDNALSLVPETSTQAQTYLIDRARIAAFDGDYALAYADLQKVYEMNSGRADILLFLASAARSLNYLDEARAALTTYLSVYSDDPTAHLEMGNLEHETGNLAAARQSWLKVLRLQEAGPDAEAARHNLEKMDLKPE
ncbi:hypothetical protein GCM10017044_07530 [Kordiimonas sediminis]|uniref:Tetratricopeptide repeat protein n=1 Tax=Kordiimonas sediminis TaxID=1735581 RepID=A0A919ANN7_9PROT|nr:tetratricopeptide repeat protein [Kordiimonas sediminis]GHF15808.1 hypothetical protein GCM10017044_07530 [Kordiimonas sediminis]